MSKGDGVWFPKKGDLLLCISSYVEMDNSLVNGQRFPHLERGSTVIVLSDPKVIDRRTTDPHLRTVIARFDARSRVRLYYVDVVVLGVCRTTLSWSDDSIVGIGGFQDLFDRISV